MGEEMAEEKKKEKTTQQPLKGEVVKTETKETPKEVSKEDIQKLADMQGADEPSLGNYDSQEPGQNLPAKAEDVRFKVAEIYGVPKYFIMMMGTPGNEHPFVTTEGLALKTEAKRPRAIQTEDVTPILADGKPVGWRCVSRIFPRITKEEIEIVKAAQTLAPEVQRELLKSLLQPYTAIGTATKENTKNTKMFPYLLELAQTRAKNRAMRSFTACGLVAASELRDYAEDESGDV